MGYLSTFTTNHKKAAFIKRLYEKRFPWLKKRVLEQGYRPTDKLDIADPPQGGSAVRRV